MLFSLTATDASGNPVTDFTATPVNLTLTIPQAAPGNTLYVYKWNPATSKPLDPQPAGYPRPVTESSGVWTVTLPSLSTFAVVDTVNTQGTQPPVTTARETLGDYLMRDVNLRRINQLSSQSSVQNVFSYLSQTGAVTTAVQDVTYNESLDSTYKLFTKPRDASLDVSEAEPTLSVSQAEFVSHSDQNTFTGALTVSQGLYLSSSHRVVVEDSGAFSFQKRENGVWVSKYSIT
jgi:hypothetical protein